MATPVVIISVLLLHGAAALQWIDTLQDGQVIYACVGDNPTISWQYQPGSQENVFSITWQFKGQTQEMMAMSSHGAFVALPAYSQRVTQTTNAGVQVHKVGLADTGNYSVEINGQDAAGAFTVNRTVQLQVADNLLTTDNQVHVTQSPSAVHDDVTGSWHLELNCGTFTYAAHPPFEVQWLSPSGVHYNSTSYRGNQFQLLVPNPVEEGSYTCEVPATAVLACLPQGQSSASEFATNGLLTRLMLLEAEQASIRRVNEILYGQTLQLQAKEASNTQRLATLETSVHQQQQTLDAQRQCCADNQAALTGMISSLNSLAQQQAADHVTMTSLFHNLTSQNPDVQGSSASNPKVSFHAKLGVDRRHRTLAVNATYSNLGNGLNLTSVFVAPVSGTYFFVASSGDKSAIEGTVAPTFYIPLQITKDDVKVAEGLDVVHAVMDLLQGQRVQVQPVTSTQTIFLLQHPDLIAYFSGFLLHR